MGRWSSLVATLFWAIGCHHQSKLTPSFQQQLESLAAKGTAQGAMVSYDEVQKFLESTYATPMAGYAVAESYLRCPVKLPAEVADAILYFSFTLNDVGELSLTSKQRLHEVERLYKLGLGKNIILTGGAGRRPLEDKVAKAHLIAKGVPAEAIWMEAKSTNTWENLGYGLELAAKQKFTSVILVSSPYHLARILRYYDKMKVERSLSFKTFWSAYEPGLDVTDLKTKRLEDRDDQILKEVHALLRDHQQFHQPLRGCVY